MNNSSKKLISEHIHFRIYQEEVETIAGTREIHEYVWRRDGTRIICLDQNMNILLQKEFRYEMNTTDWRIPGGRLDSENEEMLDGAKREFREETGYIAANWQYLWSSTPDSTVRYQRHFFLATDPQFVGTERDEGESSIETAWIALEEANRMALEGLVREEISALAITRIYFRNEHGLLAIEHPDETDK